MKPVVKALAGILAATALLSGGTIAQVRYESRPVPVYAEVYPTSFGVVDAIDAVRTDGGNNNSAAGTILGGVIGGVLGHQIGSGHGNDAATVAGAIGGAVVGHEIGAGRSEGTTYRVRVRLDNGNFQSFLQDDLDGLRIGDRIQINNDQVTHYVASAERYDSQGIRLDERGNRLVAQNSRVDERGFRYDTEGYRLDERGFRFDSQGYRVDERGSRFDAENNRVDERGYRIEERGYGRDAQGNWIDERGNRYDAQGFWVDERGIRHEYQDAPRTYLVPPPSPNR